MVAVSTRYFAPTIPICTLHWTLTYLGTSMYIGPHTCMSGYVSAYHGVGKLCILLHTILCHAVLVMHENGIQCHDVYMIHKELLPSLSSWQASVTLFWSSSSNTQRLLSYTTDHPRVQTLLLSCVSSSSSSFQHPL